MKYEVIELDQAKITVDISLLSKTEEMFFNATHMARPFGKRPDDFWKQEQNQKYLDALITLSEGNKNRGSFVQTKRGKYGGTYFHNDLALQFARWLDPKFGVRLDQWFLKRLKQEQAWRRKRLEAKTGFRPLTDALNESREDTPSYIYSNEVNMIYRIVLGMSAKKFKEATGAKNVRDAVTTEQLAGISKLQMADVGLILIGLSYQDRKEHLDLFYNNRLALPDEAA